MVAVVLRTPPSVVAAKGEPAGIAGVAGNTRRYTYDVWPQKGKQQPLVSCRRHRIRSRGCQRVDCLETDAPSADRMLKAVVPRRDEVEAASSGCSSSCPVPFRVLENRARCC